MDCIICRDTGTEQLYDNINCDCKFKRHNSCWIDYVHSQKTVKCLMCRKPIRPISPISKSFSQTNRHSTHEITYEEFQTGLGIVPLQTPRIQPEESIEIERANEERLLEIFERYNEPDQNRHQEDERRKTNMKEQFKKNMWAAARVALTCCILAVSIIIIVLCA